jgi:glycosyltransferase involved in cell wall biosynthesis
MQPELSVIIAFHEEGQRFIETTIKSAQETIDVPHEIILVDDGSRIPAEPIDGVRIIRQENQGVGVAFDTGVSFAKSENIFLMGADIRFLPNKWASKMIAEIDEHPKSIVCSTMIGMNDEAHDGMDIVARRNKSRRNGATIIMFHDHRSHPKKPKNFRNIIECQWLPIHKGGKESFEVPSVLGAAYGVKKSWYDYIDGWWGHRSWGTLEPYISLKSWLMGGSCRTTPDIETGHIFKRSSPHGIPIHHLTYNKILVATLLFHEYDAERLISFLGSDGLVQEAKKMFESNLPKIANKKEEYKEKITLDIRDFCKRWDIDFRE